MTPLGPYSTAKTIQKLDGRRREARMMAAFRAELIAHVGGKPSATQRALIDQAAWLHLHLTLMDARTVEGRALTPHDSRTYLAWSNSFSKTLRHLGLKGAAPERRTLASYAMARSA